MILADVLDASPELKMVAVVLLGGGGIVGISLKQILSHRTSVSTAYINARSDADTERRQQLAELRKELTDRIHQQNTEHKVEMSELHSEIDELRRALVEILKLVPADRLPEASAVIASLGLRSKLKEREGDTE